MYMIKTFLLMLLLTASIGQTEEKLTNKTQLEKEVEFVNFNSIKDVLKDDHLDKNAVEKVLAVKKIRQKRLRKTISKYNVPTAVDFWMVASEYWLVKNVSVLKWNFKKPDYEIEQQVIDLFKQLGIINIKFKILLLNTSALTHLYLPYKDNEFLVLLSVPFIRSLNLSQVEISLLILEEYIRSKNKLLEKRLMSKEISKYIGKNFYTNKKISFTPFKKLIKKYDELAFVKGYSFQQQFEVTKSLKRLLTGESKLRKAYLSLLKKIDQLVTNDPDYKDYIRFYPSPKVQINWFTGRQQ